jgi:hypothetical protein
MARSPIVYPLRKRRFATRSTHTVVYNSICGIQHHEVLVCYDAIYSYEDLVDDLD